MSKKYESRLKLVVPHRRQIEIKGTGEFVNMFFGQVSTRFTIELEKAIKNFKGNLEMIETTEGNQTEIEIIEKKNSDE